ncbi:hypothetical protein BOTBODRAFT_172435 [Botryobasidium botryosum FD-172 SS1]|uniref:Uncharacterized protein n=1 Tax=Botryobasidium botryosum (strain FD-172 SS1) TaxID=930990 RepID=A0A067MNS0_BOTB1|nr:hypothetical protein BOTBODRAFT_172435 [Botryobasidium botryosum FD-172 SS1]
MHSASASSSRPPRRGTATSPPSTPPRALSQPRATSACPQIQRTYRVARPADEPPRRVRAVPSTPVRRPASRSMVPPRPQIHRAYHISRPEDAQPAALPRPSVHLSPPSTPVRPASHNRTPPSRPRAGRTLPLSSEARAMLDSSLADLEAAVARYGVPALEGREPASPIGRAQEARALIARLRRDLQGC